VACGGAGVAAYEPGDVSSRVVYDTPICAKGLARVGAYLAVADMGGVRLFAVEPDGALTPAASETAFHRYRGPGDLSIRLWLGVAAWGDDRIVTADWDSVDVFELVDPAIAAQPDITASTQRIRLGPGGGSTVVRLTNQGTSALHITNVVNAALTFTVSPHAAVLEPGDTLDLSITYLGGQPGSTVLLVQSDDPDESPLPIEVHGATQYLDPGEPAAPFTLESWTFDHATREFSHGTFDLAAQSGRIVFFHVFGTWCPACLPAAADAQNTIVKAFANDPRVVTAVMSQNESRSELETFWRNVYLRGLMLFDPTGSIARDTYGQPPTGLPFSRAFIIGRDQTVVLPFFGHKPQLVIDTIDDLLAELPPFDLDGDGMVAVPDLLILLGSWGPCGDCEHCPGDLDGDCAVGVSDVLELLANWGAV
jgi:thiol-disulfide isomerase/thioredoxin